MCRQILCSSGCDYRGFVASRAHEVAIRIASFAIAVLCRCAPYEIASALSIFSGSKPMTVSLPIRVTGVVMAPRRLSSSRAETSLVTSRSLNFMPFCERYSFVCWQNIQPG
jgi:hypothetical protein